VLPFTYDPLTQFVVAVPVIGLFELSLLAIWLVNGYQLGQPHRGVHRPLVPPQAAPLSPSPLLATQHLRLDERRPVQLG
jgi:hypothetical protein